MPRPWLFPLLFAVTGCGSAPPEPWFVLAPIQLPAATDSLAYPLDRWRLDCGTEPLTPARLALLELRPEGVRFRDREVAGAAWWAGPDALVPAIVDATDAARDPCRDAPLLIAVDQRLPYEAIVRAAYSAGMGKFGHLDLLVLGPAGEPWTPAPYEAPRTVIVTAGSVEVWTSGEEPGFPKKFGPTEVGAAVDAAAVGAGVVIVAEPDLPLSRAMAVMDAVQARHLSATFAAMMAEDTTGPPRAQEGPAEAVPLPPDRVVHVWPLTMPRLEPLRHDLWADEAADDGKLEEALRGVEKSP